MKIVFYRIDFQWIQLGKVYDFPIFLLAENTQQRVVQLYPETEVTQEHLDEIENFVSKGAIVQIHEEFIDIAQEQLNINREELESLNREKVDFLNLVEKRLREYEGKYQKEFNLKETVKRTSGNGSFENLRERVRVDLLKYPLDKDPVINFTLCLVENLFNRDLMAVKNTVLAYFIALEIGLKDEKTLGEILLAGLLKDIGMCMIPPSSFQKYEELKQDEYYLKHPFLTLYYLAKLDLPFSKELKRFIMEHHEDSKGEGYPRGKLEDYIAMPSFILNLAEQIVMLSEGISGQGIDLAKALNLFSRKTALGDMNLNIPEHILNALESIAPSES